MERLDDTIRPVETIDELVFLVRGGVDTLDKLQRQSAALARRFSYAGHPARGISLFAAVDDADIERVLRLKMRTYPKYRRIAARDLKDAGLLLPTFAAPHWTLLFTAPELVDGAREEDRMRRFLDVLGKVRDNPACPSREPRR